MSNIRLNIEIATIENVGILAKMDVRTFCHTYQQYNGPEDIASYVTANFTLKNIGQQLHDPGVTFLIERRDNHNICYVKSTQKPPPISCNLPAVVELERIWVLSCAVGRVWVRI